MSLNEIEEIKQRLDIVEHIGQYVALKKAGANYKGVCPFHSEKTPSMMVSNQKQIWKCFGCGKGGDIFAFTMEAEHLEFGDALRMLAQKAGVTLQTRTTAEHQTQSRKDRIYRTNMLSAKIFQRILSQSSLGEVAREYLQKRKITSAVQEKFLIGFAPKNFDLKATLSKYELTAGDLQNAGSPERFFDRIMFPIFDVLGNVIAFTGRAVANIEPKYLNSPETPIFNKGRVLYGLNFAKGAIKQKDFVILVEGQMDVIALHQSGVENTVASSGTAITETQINTLSKYTNNFILALDNDTAGITTTKKVIEILLKLDLNGKIINFGKYKDAGELFENEPTAWPEALKNAEEMFDWLINQELSAAGSIQYIENKKKIIKSLLPVIAVIQDPTRLEYCVNKLATKTQTKAENIISAVEKMWQKKTEEKPNKNTKIALTPEEQLLAIILGEPQAGVKFAEQLDQVVWQSIDNQQIASVVKKCYTNKTLASDRIQFISSVKTTLDSRLSEKIDSWQFWLSELWPNLTTSLATELITEHFGRLNTKSREAEKELLASQIRQAQEKNDTKKVIELMQQLNELTKEVK
ncbi:DNA primase [Candidatus Berkelbacteria bacterium]|nr:DNA primase [Candidatus Berkelbacteria bacterium]